ncbi:MAG: hypothetical protein K2Q01_02530, partial [Rickettsiales bacterium]|nr:hypothetical protein [Rickettsiales bacterium]
MPYNAVRAPKATRQALKDRPILFIYDGLAKRQTVEELFAAAGVRGLRIYANSPDDAVACLQRMHDAGMRPSLIVADY